jgi:hypothetical protein
MSIVLINKTPVFVKLLNTNGKEIHIVIKHITSVIYNDDDNITTINMVNSNIYTVTTTTDLLYQKIIDNISILYQMVV